MPITFFPDNNDDRDEEIRRKSEEFQRKYGESGPRERGIEEQDLEDIVPGGSYLSMALPFGSSKIRKGTSMLRKLAEKEAPAVRRAARELGEEFTEEAAEKAPSTLSWLPEGNVGREIAEKEAIEAAEKKVIKEGPTINYKKARDAEDEARRLSEKEARTIDYLKHGRESGARAARRDKIKPTAYEYVGGHPIEKK